VCLYQTNVRLVELGDLGTRAWIWAEAATGSLNFVEERAEVMASAEQQFRLEKDSMGEVKVPQHAYYGAQTQRAIDNFPISQRRFPREFIRAIGLIKKAATEVNQELGLLEARLAEPIVRAAQEVIDGSRDAISPSTSIRRGRVPRPI
jgi:hypothetical protein